MKTTVLASKTVSVLSLNICKPKSFFSRPLHGHSPANRRIVQLRDPLNNHPARHQRPCGQLRPSRSSRAAEEPRHLCHQGSTAEAGHLWRINKSLRFQQKTFAVSVVLSSFHIVNCLRDTDITKLSRTLPGQLRKYSNNDR